MNAIFFRFPFFLHDLVHLFSQFKDLCFQLNVLLDHFFPIRSIFVDLSVRSILYLRSLGLRYKVFFVVFLLGGNFLMRLFRRICLEQDISCEPRLILVIVRFFLVEIFLILVIFVF